MSIRTRQPSQNEPYMTPGRKPSKGRRRKARPPRRTTRPQFLTLAALLVVASLVGGYMVLNRSAGTTPTASSSGGRGDKGSADKSVEPKWDGKTKIIGDGSTSYTGPQKGRLKAEPLKPGEKPPQFVVFSWDGALAGDDELFQHYREMAKKYDAHMTFFLSGIYLLPQRKKELYDAPQHEKGDAAISYPTDEHIRTTIEQLGKAWEEGNEIGTHFNGHFCEAKGGGEWSVAEWKQEIEEFNSFLENWKTNTGYSDLDPLPFDTKAVTGGRAPCLEGQQNLMKAAKEFGYRYDASSPGGFQVWPGKKNGMWDFPLQMLPYDDDYQALSMDFNFLYNQSNGETEGDPAMYPTWQRETIDTYMAGFNRVYYGSRAPLFIGNHFEQWNGGIYMNAVDEVIKNVCTKKDVKCVSFDELADWMDVQKPETLANLRALDPAQAPSDWSTVVK
jgi:peptidoglycan/xylan/chitin deacetylase (PgdA/CDA1 family)